jgi:excisionase family DNA binding protein
MSTEPVLAASPLPRLLTISDLMASLGVSRSTVNNMVDRGQLRAIKLGRGVRFKADEVLALINGESR